MGAPGSILIAPSTRSARLPRCPTDTSANVSPCITSVGVSLVLVANVGVPNRELLPTGRRRPAAEFRRSAGKGRKGGRGRLAPDAPRSLRH